MDNAHDQSPQTGTQPARAPGRGSLASPRMFFLVAAFLSFLLSVGLFFTGDHERGIFVGIWVPSILSAGTLILTGNNR